MVYFNIKTQGVVETIDEINPKDFPTYEAFIKEKRRLLTEYHIAGISTYSSQRCTNEWKKS